MKEKTIKRLVLPMRVFTFFLLVYPWKKYSFESPTFGKSFNTGCNPKNVPTMQLGRILTGDTTTVQSPPMYTNLKDKLMNTSDESSTDLFSKRLNALIQDENFRKQYERLFQSNEFTQIFSDMILDHEKLKKKGVLNGSHFMNNDASSDWAEAIKKLSFSSDRKDAAGKFTHPNRKKRSRNFDQSDESLNLDYFDDDCAHVDDNLSTFTGSVKSLFEREQQIRFPHHRHHHNYYDDDYVDDDLTTFTGSVESLFKKERDHFHDDLTTNFGSVESIFKEEQTTVPHNNIGSFDDDLSTNYGSTDSIFKEQQTTIPHHRHHHHYYDDDMSRNFGSVESIFNEPNDGYDVAYVHHDYADNVSTNFGSVDTLFKEQRRFSYDDRRVNPSVGTCSCKSEYTGTDYYDSYGNLYHVVDQNNEHERAKAQAGVHLPMLDEHFIEEYKYCNIPTILHKRNSVKQKIYKHIPWMRKFFNKMDAKVESEIMRYLDIKEREKQNYPVRKVKGTQKLFNFLSKYRVFVPLDVFGTLPVILLVFLLTLEFIATFSLLPLMTIALVCGGYSRLVSYYKRKVKKMRHIRKHIKKLSTMRNKDDE
ncbi:Uncharacterized protein PCOAH_00029720 [Plasmodium coatneyi]|uniref:Pv-fam-d protein n=1 Tax=Plasmodium coatneyi TaxID=208452 RepID=A0A1B1E0F9_9APIC|nr:Uncharacterized protein PCOAH_00029720 [Plasmodium coatneyi]ANQ08508.1 Uncharacterized protein PCOAH_00029720 [Plasmodium coatneyi]